MVVVAAAAVVDDDFVAVATADEFRMALGKMIHRKSPTLSYLVRFLLVIS